MKLIAFSIYDEKAAAYLPPFFFPNDLVAQRAFHANVNDPNHMFGKYPSDYTLFQVGIFDDEKATFVQDKHPICNGLEVIDARAMPHQTDLVNLPQETTNAS